MSGRLWRLAAVGCSVESLASQRVYRKACVKRTNRPSAAQTMSPRRAISPGRSCPRGKKAFDAAIYTQTGLWRPLSRRHGRRQRCAWTVLAHVRPSDPSAFRVWKSAAERPSCATYLRSISALSAAARSIPVLTLPSRRYCSRGSLDLKTAAGDS